MNELSLILAAISGLSIIMALWSWSKSRSDVLRLELVETQRQSLENETQTTRGELARIQTEVATLQARLENREHELAELRRERAAQEQQQRDSAGQQAYLQVKLAELHERLLQEQKAGVEKLKLLEEARAQLGDAFKALSAEALRANNESFLKLAQENLQRFQQAAQNDLAQRQQAITQLTQPIHERLEKFDGKLDELERARLGAYHALEAQLKALLETHLPQLHRETANLVKALRQPQVRGRWGEVQLKRVVEMAGMLEHCDFEEQVSQTTESGRLRPDMIVHLPGGRRIVVDAKAPVEAYLEAVEAQTDSARTDALAKHARQVRAHITQLGRKAYFDQFDPTTTVEMAGMLEHCDFEEQVSQTTESGRLRPDMIVHLPGGRRIVVDAKAPVEAYLEAVEAQTDSARTDALAKHARQVRAHITQLGRKAYFDQFDPTPEFVVLFVPGEAFFSAALAQDIDLIEYGAENRVIPASPTTLIALLKAVAYGWRQEAIGRNATEIAGLGKALYDRVAILADHWDKVGSRLNQAVGAYNQAVGSLEGRVLPSARKFRDLQSVSADKEIETLSPLTIEARPLTAPEFQPKDNRA